MSDHPLPDANHLPQFTPQDQSDLSELQLEFNAKIKQIDLLKAELAEKRQSVEGVRARVKKELSPLVRELVDKRIAYVTFLDGAYDAGFLRLSEKVKLAHLLKNLTTALVENYGKTEIIPLQEKYHLLTFDQDAYLAAEEAKAQAQEALKKMLGLDVGEHDLQDLDSLQAKLDQQMFEEQERREAERAHRKKSKAKQTQETKQKVDKQTISKATRRVYTNLVKLLHPDKEQDSMARAWKEEAIKKVTIAYGNDDFYELLRLQMEFMHLQEQQLLQLPDEQLWYYIKMLSDQIKDLEEENANFNRSQDARLYQELGGAPKQSEIKFRRAKGDVKNEIKSINQDLAQFQDPDFLAAYLMGLNL